MNIRLIDLYPQWIKRNSDISYEMVSQIADADGIIFLCPRCMFRNGMSSIGVHSVICWAPSVPQTTSPTPGRWNMTGTGFHDLTLVAGSSSIRLTGGCEWHGFIRNGEATDA